jgi:hypothetical protein
VIDSAPAWAAGAKEAAMPRLFAVGIVAALAWIAVPAGADSPRSLGEVAAKDKDKKKGKVYTEEDLRNPKKGGSYSQPAAEGGTTAATTPAGEKKPEVGASPGAAKPKTDDELRAEAETAWREKMTQAQADVATWTAEVNRLQLALNDNRGPMYGPGRAATGDALENAKRQLAAANTAVETLQEEGRRNRYR